MRLLSIIGAAMLLAACAGTIGGTGRDAGTDAGGDAGSDPGPGDPGPGDPGPGDSGPGDPGPGDPGPGDPGVDAGGGDDGGPSTSFTWTEFTPSADNRIIYLSTSGGDDGNDCLSEGAACETLGRGISLLRDGFPDWLLLKKGDVWDETFSGVTSWAISGRSAAEPMLISSYGTGPRPLLKAGGEHGFLRDRAVDVHDLAVVGLHFKAHTRDPHSPEYVGRDGVGFQAGFRWTGGGSVQRILIEDCKFEYFKGNFGMHPSGDAPLFEDVSVRGNVFYSAWSGSVDEYSQGMFADGIDGLLIEGNVFDRNGGLIGFEGNPHGVVPPGLTATDVAASWFNHQAYINSRNVNVVVRNNIFADGDGMQLRPGGIAEDNLFTRCINSMNFGPATTPVAGGVHGRVAGNVFLEGTDFSLAAHDLNKRATGINVANLQAASGLVIEGNVFAHDMSAGHYGHAVSASGNDCGSGNAYPCPVHNLSIQGNVLYDWRGGFEFHGNLGNTIGDITVSGNLIQNPADDRAALLNLDCGHDPGEFSFSDNRYHRGGNASWFRVSGNDHDFAAWTGLASDAGSQAGIVEFADPDRSLGAYNALQGGPATHDAFMQRARDQSKDNWNPAYEPVNINTYFREGFIVTGP